VQGVEAGGHVHGTVSILVKVELIVRVVNLPVVASAIGAPGYQESRSHLALYNHFRTNSARDQEAPQRKVERGQCEELTLAILRTTAAPMGAAAVSIGDNVIFVGTGRFDRSSWLQRAGRQNPARRSSFDPFRLGQAAGLA
jgi:hypothetical protein